MDEISSYIIMAYGIHNNNNEEQWTTSTNNTYHASYTERFNITYNV